MSEYIEIETEGSDDPALMAFHTNLRLSEEGVEQYDSVGAMEEGSPLAQALAQVDGIRRLRLEGSAMVVTRSLDTPWHLVVSDVSAVVKDFFL